ncbi:quinol dehydrogenase ferredoxin subunit NapH [Helicobacter cetorum]|uniref:Quinol dehydrogenase membrane component n=1 Tax=Helicobacter cetorum (strain ATCC BAA-540 / CCUG 52418 / MIT 99-5656) TaxID=1163745 RepID=I0ET57_HELCM|nr:quinol dehydrogenase ferredoxin subunit NapH [Helicobacter cetorum]AFI06126.1 quinol dehydrogenase membrane component [Helicobacter cetorum MIT 99-5656]
MCYLIARRVTQITILILFVLGIGFKGNLSSSVIFSKIPLSDPFAILQLYLAGFSIGFKALIGAVIVLGFYALIVGRAFCAWVCPVNMITDLAYFMREKTLFKRSKILNISKSTRYYVLTLSLILSFVLGLPAFEEVSYIGIIHRGIIFGSLLWIMVGLIIFCVDLFLNERLICSRICPLGAFYALVSRFSLLKISHNVNQCTKCYKCLAICPEKQVLNMVGKRSEKVKSGECIKCGCCIEVCKDNALSFNLVDLLKKEKR